MRTFKVSFLVIACLLAGSVWGFERSSRNIVAEGQPFVLETLQTTQGVFEVVIPQRENDDGVLVAVRSRWCVKTPLGLKLPNDQFGSKWNFVGVSEIAGETYLVTTGDTFRYDAKTGGFTVAHKKPWNYFDRQCFINVVGQYVTVYEGQDAVSRFLGVFSLATGKYIPYTGSKVLALQDSKLLDSTIELRFVTQPLRGVIPAVPGRAKITFDLSTETFVSDAIAVAIN